MRSKGSNASSRSIRSSPGWRRGSCKLVCGCAKNVRFEPGEYLFHEGDAGRPVLSAAPRPRGARAHVAGRGAVTFQTLREGEIVGVSWLSRPIAGPMTRKALELVRAIAMDAACLRGKCEADHDLGYEMMKRFMPVLIERLQATRMQMLDVYGAHG